MNGVSRYHPLRVVLQGLLALLIVGALAPGFLVLEPMANSSPGTIDVLRLHMAGGMLILTLAVVRVIVQVASAHPTPPHTSYPLLERLASLAHLAVSSLVVLMVATGDATGIRAGLPAIVFGRSGAPLPRAGQA